MYLIGIIRRSQRRGRFSLITAADARDGRPKSCQGRTAAEKLPTLPKNRPKKLEFCRVSKYADVTRSSPAKNRAGESQAADGADGAELARLPTVFGDGETEPSRRRSAVVSDHSRDGRRDAAAGKRTRKNGPSQEMTAREKSRMRV